MGIMVMGGFYPTSVELYNPATNFSCYLPDLPSNRFSTVNHEFLVCGGGGSSTSSSCLLLVNGTWTSAHTLYSSRVRSSIWDSSKGLVIMGGLSSSAENTAELLKDDFSSEYSFSLSASTRDACSITDYESDTVILTGGYPTNSKVQRYGHSGLIETLPDLNYKRYAHACSSYIKDGKQVLLVAGGRDSSYLSSTEIFCPDYDSAWTVMSPLPLTRSYCEAVTLNNKIYLIGNWNTGNGDHVYEWDGEEEEWTLHGTILTERTNVGVSLVPLSSGVMDYCSTSSDVKDEETVEDSPDPNLEDLN